MVASLQIGGSRIDLDRELVIRPDGAEVRPYLAGCAAAVGTGNAPRRCALG
jgi:hypothetical protein